MPPRAPGGKLLWAAAVPIPRLLRLSFAALALAIGGPAHAQTEHAGDHLHMPLTSSADLAWPELIDATVQNFPRFIELAARDEEAQALVGRGRSLLASQPRLLMGYKSDSPWDNVNLREYELGVEVPLWRPGERRAAASVGAAAQEGATASAIALRHEVVGLLRMALWDVEWASNELAVAREGARVAGELQLAVERRFEVGEVALNETLLVRSTAMERAAEVIEAEALLVDAERAYQSLTGLNVKPVEIAEPLTDRDDFDDSHPRLLLANADLDRARAELDVARRSSKGNPALTIGPQRERGAFSDYSANSLNVSLSMPFGGGKHSAVVTAASARAAAKAESDRLQLLRELDFEVHEARHGLSVIEESLELARQRLELATRSFEMNERAFSQGEITLLELLRSEETALFTQREVAGLEVEQQRAIAQINQAVGVWP